MKSWLTIGAVTIAFAAFSQASSENILVPATGREALSRKSSKKHNYRLDVVRNGDEFVLAGFGMLRLPGSLKNIRFKDGSTKRQQITEMAEASIDSSFAFLKANTKNVSYQIPREAEVRRQKEKFLTGKRAGSFIGNQWISIDQIETTDLTNFQFQTGGLFRKHHQYKTDLLPAKMVWELPALDPWHCQPIQLRFFELRKLQGYGLDKIKYEPFRERERIVERRSFEIYFEQNETKPAQEQLAAVVDFLERNNFVILNATLEGGCSIEGPRDRNMWLQRQRASVLQRTLRRYADELLEKDTVQYADMFAQFRSLIKKSAFEWLDTLTNEKISQLVNRDATLQQSLEPYLALQRKATLQLAIAKRLTKQEQVDRLAVELEKVSAQLGTPHQTKLQAEAKVNGMIEVLFKYYRRKIISRQAFDSIISTTSNSNYLQILTGYFLLKEFESNEVEWLKAWNKLDYREILGKAQAGAINLVQSPGRFEKAKLLRMLTDFQAYNYKFVELHLIPASDLCFIPYPKTRDFFPLILNQYAFLFEISRDETHERVACVGRPGAPPPRDSVVNTDKFIDAVTAANARQFSLIQGRLVLQKSFDVTPKSPYYLILKQYFVKGDQQVLQHVQYENSGDAVTLTAFNLIHLLRENIDGWEPFENHFYDQEIQLEEMSKLVSLLQRIDDNICRPIINDLYLDFHLKMLYHLQYFQEPGNAMHTRFAENALKFITTYYKQRAHQINPRFALHLTGQLNMFYNLPGKNAGAWYGYDLLSAISRQRILNEDELKLFCHYLKLYNPSLKKLSLRWLNKEQIPLLWNEVF